jgi:hypothetical protein
MWALEVTVRMLSKKPCFTRRAACFRALLVLVVEGAGQGFITIPQLLQQLKTTYWEEISRVAYSFCREQAPRITMPLGGHEGQT